MPTELEYEGKARSLSHPELLALWEQIEKRQTSGWDAGKAFEYLVLRAFEIEGASVHYPYRIKMEDEVVEQIDGALHVDGISALVESKDLGDDTPVNIEPIAKLRNQLLRRPSPTVGLLFSRTGFTDPALVLARYLWPQTILVWNRPEVAYALKRQKFRSGLVMKYRMAVELGQNDFTILTADEV
jgi:hypothetical protein